jgi:2-C-methyl-D-erythritol 4-phosphate cytidylyltransferase
MAATFSVRSEGFPEHQVREFLRNPGPADHVLLAAPDGYDPDDPSVTIVPVRPGASAAQAWTALVAALPAEISVVLLYEVDRLPSASDLAERVLAALPTGLGWSVPVLEMAETVKIVDAGQRVVGTVDRDTVLRMPCPQAATRPALEAVLRTVPADFSLNSLPFYAERLGIAVVRVAG